MSEEVIGHTTLLIRTYLQATSCFWSRPQTRTVCWREGRKSGDGSILRLHGPPERGAAKTDDNGKSAIPLGHCVHETGVLIRAHEMSITVSASLPPGLLPRYTTW
ncbi:hypothetical protein VTK26DRAFT_1959 [Humicola hyalothermophila]